MLVEQDNKKLYHIQIEQTGGWDSTLDFFAWCKEEPSQQQIYDLIINDFTTGNDTDLDIIDSFRKMAESAQVYTVYAEQL